MTSEQDEEGPSTPLVIIKQEGSFGTKKSNEKRPHRKTSEKQKEELIKFFEANPDYVKVVAGNAGDSAMKSKIWNSVARRLNEVEGGVLKSELKWAKSWADMKVYAKSRAKLAVAGLAPQNAKRPTDLDRRILTVIGQEELLMGWEHALAEDSNSSSTRQVPLEHDYEITGFQDADDTVDINFLDETEERLDPEEYLDQPGTSQQQRYKPKTIRQAINRFSDGEGMETMEFYIEDEHNEEGHIMEEPHTELVTVEPAPKSRPKRLREPSTYAMAQPPTKLKKEANQDDQYAKAMVTLADALNNVAGALYTISETLRTVKR